MTQSISEITRPRAAIDRDGPISSFAGIWIINEPRAEIGGVIERITNGQRGVPGMVVEFSGAKVDGNPLHHHRGLTDSRRIEINELIHAGLFEIRQQSRVDGVGVGRRLAGGVYAGGRVISNAALVVVQ